MKKNRLTAVTTATLLGFMTTPYAGTVGITGTYSGDYQMIAMAHTDGNPDNAPVFMGQAIDRQIWSWDFNTGTATFEPGQHALTIGVPYELHNADAINFTDNGDGTYTGLLDFQVYNPGFGNPRAWLEITWDITDDGMGNLAMITADGDGNGFAGTIAGCGDGTPACTPSWAGFPFPFEPTWDGQASASAVSAVPLPAAVWLFGSGLLGLAGVARTRNKV